MTEHLIRVGTEGTAAAMAGGYPGMQVDPFEQEETPRVDPRTVMSDLKATLAEDISVEPIDLNVPKRPNINMVFTPFIDFDLLKMWTRKSRETKKTDSPVDQKKLCSIVLAETCTGMKFRVKNADGSGFAWVDMFGEHDGEPMTFKHRETQSMLGAIQGSWLSAIEKMYGSDGHIIQVAKIVLDAAGYGDFDMEDGGDPLDS